ncbi:hypothetical protein EZY14_009375 [Kordia sp. TARA_039_SRF]|nr:hypothetical protein EZY14_009375 [Kordia sp. TARA_039_SRF]
MARSINEIQESLLQAKEQASELSALEVLTESELNTLENVNTTSKVALWRLWLYIQAVGIWILEKLLDITKDEIIKVNDEKQIHNREWYRNQALNFQLGYDLDELTRAYDNSNLDTDQIAGSKIIKHASIVKRVTQGRGSVIVKVATEDGDGERIPLNQIQMEAFTDYMNEITDAGTIIIPQSGVADDIKMEIDVYFDPEIMSNTGQLLDGSSETPVVDSINEFLRSINFNGIYIKTENKLELEKVSGVKYAVIKSASSKYGLYNYQDDTIQNAGLINEFRNAESGYFKLDIENTIINYIALEQQYL